MEDHVRWTMIIMMVGWILGTQVGMNRDLSEIKKQVNEVICVALEMGE